MVGVKCLRYYKAREFNGNFIILCVAFENEIQLKSFCSHRSCYELVMSN